MKTLIISFIFSIASAHAYECKLTGNLSSEETIETSFVTGSVEECRKLAEKTGENNFFGLVEKDNSLVETSLSFREEEGLKKDTVSFESAEFSSDG